MGTVLARLGRSIESQGAELRFFLRTLRLLFFASPRAWRFRLPLLSEQLGRSGILTIPIATLMSTLIGMILVLETAPVFANYGQTSLVAGLVGAATAKALGPLVTAIIVTGRVGAAYTAEIGTMNVNEELLAAETMAVNPVDLSSSSPASWRWRSRCRA
jgi:phospholipid/cholesterol/gamma-HCH transport system permease protein